MRMATSGASARPGKPWKLTAPVSVSHHMIHHMIQPIALEEYINVEVCDIFLSLLDIVFGCSTNLKTCPFSDTSCERDIESCPVTAHNAPACYLQLDLNFMVQVSCSSHGALLNSM